MDKQRLDGQLDGYIEIEWIDRNNMDSVMMRKKDRLVGLIRDQIDS